MTFLKKALYFRLLLASVILISVLFINVSSRMMVIMLFLSSLLCLCDTFFEAYSECRNKDLAKGRTFAVIATYVSFFAEYEFEACFFALAYRVIELILILLKNKIRDNAVKSVKREEERNIVIDVLSYKNAPLTKSEKILRASSRIFILGIIGISIVIMIVLPVFCHYNFRTSIHRAVMILYLASETPLFFSLSTIGNVSLCFSANSGIIFNCAESLENLDEKGIIYSRDKIDLFQNTTSIEVSSTIDQDTFLNIVAHVVDKSDQDFAEIIKKQLYDYSVDNTLISDYSIFEDNGISCEINGMRVLFGNLSFLSQFGIEDVSLSDEEYTLYIADRMIGKIGIPETNVSYNDSTMMYELSAQMGSIAKANVLIAAIVKGLLISFSISGIMKLWLIVLIEGAFLILEALNSVKVKNI